MNEIVIQITSVTKRCITRYLILTNLRIQESDKIGMIEIRSMLLHYCLQTTTLCSGGTRGRLPPNTHFYWMH
jgi:hypothetical protein